MNTKKPFKLVTQKPKPSPFPVEPDEKLQGGTLDLNKHVLKHPDSSFYVRVSSDGLSSVGIHDGDLLVVDRTLEVKNMSVVVVAADKQLLVSRVAIVNGEASLVPDKRGDKMPDEFDIWGVVSHVIHEL